MTAWEVPGHPLDRTRNLYTCEKTGRVAREVFFFPNRPIRCNLCCPKILRLWWEVWFGFRLIMRTHATVVDVACTVVQILLFLAFGVLVALSAYAFFVMHGKSWPIVNNLMFNSIVIGILGAVLEGVKELIERNLEPPVSRWKEARR